MLEGGPLLLRTLKVLWRRLSIVCALRQVRKELRLLLLLLLVLWSRLRMRLLMLLVEEGCRGPGIRVRGRLRRRVRRVVGGVGEANGLLSRVLPV